MTHLLHILRTSLVELARRPIHPALSDSLANAPFAHLLPNIKPRDAGYGQDWSYRLHITGPLSASQGKTLRSIYRVPRTLPYNRPTFITFLNLQDVHFRAFADLLNVLAELSDVSSFLGERLTWPKVTESPVIAARYLSRKLRLHQDDGNVLFMDCTTGQYWLALLLMRPASCSDRLDELIRQIDERVPNATSLCVRCTELTLRTDFGECVVVPYCAGDLNLIHSAFLDSRFRSFRALNCASGRGVASLHYHEE